MIGVYASAIGAILGVVIAWDKLDMPRPALHTEVATVEQFSKDTRVLVLNQEWFRLKIELRTKQVQLLQNPGDFNLIQEVTRLEQQMRMVEEQLKKLSE